MLMVMADATKTTKKRQRRNRMEAGIKNLSLSRSPMRNGLTARADLYLARPSPSALEPNRTSPFGPALASSHGKESEQEERGKFDDSYGPGTALGRPIAVGGH